MTNDEIKRLRWACRRGMLELDLFILPFFDTQFIHLSPPEQFAFKALLQVSDPELYRWLMGHDTPTESAYLNLIAKIQAHQQAPWS